MEQIVNNAFFAGGFAVLFTLAIYVMAAVVLALADHAQNKMIRTFYRKKK